MAFYVTHTNGKDESDPPLASLPALLAELDSTNAAHATVALTHESDWCLTVSPGGAVALEHPEDDSTVHMLDVPDEHILELWEHLAQGDVESVKGEAWEPGYPA